MIKSTFVPKRNWISKTKEQSNKITKVKRTKMNLKDYQKKVPLKQHQLKR